MNQPTPEPRSGSRRPDLGKRYPAGQRQNGRFWEPPVSVKQAKARVRNAEKLLEANVRDGIDVGYAVEILDEAEDDYREMALFGEVDEGRTAAMEARLNELGAVCAELEAEVIVREAMRDLDDGTALWAPQASARAPHLKAATSP